MHLRVTRAQWPNAAIIELYHSENSVDQPFQSLTSCLAMLSFDFLSISINLD